MQIIEIITELAGAKQALATDYQAVLKSNGFTPLGAGSFATVWEHPKFDYVLKTFNARDTAYLQWIEACLAHQNNPFIPKFVSAKPARITSGVLGIRLEKLSPATGAARNILRQTEELVNECSIDAPEPIDDVREIREVMEDSYPELVPFADANAGYLEAVALIVNIINNGSGTNDLANGDNTMIRGNQLVFTDPV